MGPERLLQRAKGTNKRVFNQNVLLSDLCVSSRYPLFEQRLCGGKKKLDRNCMK